MNEFITNRGNKRRKNYGKYGNSNTGIIKNW